MKKYGSYLPSHIRVTVRGQDYVIPNWSRRTMKANIEGLLEDARGHDLYEGKDHRCRAQYLRDYARAWEGALERKASALLAERRFRRRR